MKDICDNNSIAHLIGSIEQLAEIQKESAREFKEYRSASEAKMDKMVEALSKVEVILVKQTHLDDKIESLNSRTHKRIDDIVEQVEKIVGRQETTGCPTLRTARAYYNGEVAESKRERAEFREVAEKMVYLPEKVKVANERILNLEADSKRYSEKADDMKTKFIFTIIAAAIGVIASFYEKGQ